MSGKISLALKAGLLHDVGKVCIRATHERQRHSILGAEFIRSFLADTEADKQLLRCIKYHHGRELSGAGLEIADWSGTYSEDGITYRGFQRFCADWRRRQSFYQGSVDKGANHSGELFEGENENTFSKSAG